MTNRWRHDDTLVQTMRVQAPGLDRLTARLRAERVLQTVPLRPTGLPPAAVFCVRRLRVKRFPVATTVPTDVWQREVQAALDGLLRKAVRPVQEAVPANAEAVLFGDHAEMLACLARDWLAGVIASRWWWRSLLRGGARPAAVVPLWIDSPEHVPAALAQLATDGQAATFVHALGPAQAEVLLRKVLTVHGLPQVVAVVEQAIVSDDESAPDPELDEKGRADGSRAAGPAPPWQPWVPEADDAGLHAVQQLLIGVSLMLQRWPAIARSVSFVKRLADWRRAATVARLASPAMIDLREAASKPGDMTTTSPTEPARTMTPAAPHKVVLTPGPEPTTTTPTRSNVTAAASLPTVAGDSSQAEPIGDGRIEQPVDRPNPPPEQPQQAPEIEMPQTETTQTELGGMFYLINLGLFLELYGDFTSPARPGLALSIWDFVFLLGQRLLGEQRAADAVWSLLTRLAGRGADTPPGHGFQPPDAWRLPSDWLRPFPEADAWSWSASADRLRVWHPAGFPIIDVPRNGAREDDQLGCEIAAYACALPCTLASLPLDAEEGKSPLERWLDWLLPYVRARLCRALGVADAMEAGALLLVHRARVLTSATRVDLAMSLAELPIAIRLAGLDRDPGWVPAAGRFIAFHYE
jgi:hypothetical protein